MEARDAVNIPPCPEHPQDEELSPCGVAVPRLSSCEVIIALSRSCLPPKKVPASTRPLSGPAHPGGTSLALNQLGGAGHCFEVGSLGPPHDLCRVPEGQARCPAWVGLTASDAPLVPRLSPPRLPPHPYQPAEGPALSPPSLFPPSHLPPTCWPWASQWQVRMPGPPHPATQHLRCWNLR